VPFGGIEITICNIIMRNLQKTMLETVRYRGPGSHSSSNMQVLFLVLAYLSLVCGLRATPGQSRLKSSLSPLRPSLIHDPRDRVAVHTLRAGQNLYARDAAIVHGVLGTVLALSKQKSLTTAGLVHSTALGFGLWSFVGPKGWLLCAAYLVLGSIVTKIKIAEKQVL
jgi:hypothetical protein